MSIVRFLAGSGTALVLVGLLGLVSSVIIPLNPISDRGVEIPLDAPELVATKAETTPDAPVPSVDQSPERSEQLEVQAVQDVETDTLDITTPIDPAQTVVIEAPITLAPDATAISRPERSQIARPTPSQQVKLDTSLATPLPPAVEVEVVQVIAPVATPAAEPDLVLPTTQDEDVGEVEPRQTPVFEQRPMQTASIDKNALIHGATGEPMFAIILLAPDDPGIMVELTNLGIPLTLAVGMENSLATDIADFGYAIGMEVVAYADGSLGDDLAGALKAGFAAIPQAIGVLDNTKAALQRDEKVSRDLLQALSVEGYAVISYDRPRDLLAEYAPAARVPHTQVFRILDRNSETRSTIRNSLKRAALQARSSGAVVVLGTATQDMLSVLGPWLEGEEAQGLDFTPLSSIVLKD